MLSPLENAVLNALAFVWVLGALIVWPLYRRFRRTHAKRLLWLRAVFVLHVLGVASGAAYVAKMTLDQDPDAGMAPLILYIVGTFSWATSAAILIVGTLTARIKGLR